MFGTNILKHQELIFMLPGVFIWKGVFDTFTKLPFLPHAFELHTNSLFDLDKGILIILQTQLYPLKQSQRRWGSFKERVFADGAFTI